MSQEMSTLRRGPSPRLGERRLRRLAELALIAIAAVWGLTFVMVQDAIALLPTMAFLAYRFIPAALIVAVIFRRPLRQLPVAGWRAGLLMGVFLAGGYIFQTLGLWLLSGAGGEFDLRGDGLVLLCAFSLAAHILATAHAVRRFDVGALLAVQLGVVGIVSLAIAAAAGQLEPPEGATVWSALLVTSLVASALGFFVQSFAQKHAPPARTALILAAVEVAPRLRPPRPLPEG